MERKGNPGVQGSEGKPCTTCQCQHSLVTKTHRMIKERGVRTLYPTDENVIITSEARVDLWLPEIHSEIEESDDYQYTAREIVITAITGGHFVKTKSSLNVYHNMVELDQYKRYIFISYPGGWYMVE